jgi:hypothetical protein
LCFSVTGLAAFFIYDAILNRTHYAVQGACNELHFDKDELKI